MSNMIDTGNTIRKFVQITPVPSDLQTLFGKELRWIETQVEKSQNRYGRGLFATLCSGVFCVSFWD